MFSNLDQNLMLAVLKLAKSASDLDEVPVGAIIIDQNSNIISQAYNLKESAHNPCAHAEILAIQQACTHIKNWRLTGFRLFVNLEPCLMCAGAIYQARISEVIYGCSDPKAGAMGSLYEIHSDTRLNHRPIVRSGLLADESSKLLKDFFQKKR